MGWRAKAWQFVIVPQHSNGIVAIFSGLLFIATTVYAVFAGLQWYITRQAMQKEQRAWVVIKDAGTELDIAKTITHKFIVVNNGKTPAKNVQGTFKMEILDRDSEPSFDLSNRDEVGSFSTPLMMPDDPSTLGINPLSQLPGTKLLQAQIMTDDLKKKYTDGKIWLALVFSTSYKDAFGTQHWLKICRHIISREPGTVFSTPAGVNACTNYNKADDN